MSSFWGSCFGRQKNSTKDDPVQNGFALPPAGRREIDNVNPAKCIFCNVTPDRFNIVLQDEEFICFRDRSPAAAVHLLVIPRTHIANVQSLTQRDSDLVRQMQALGRKALELVSRSSSGAVPEWRFGFHIPPFRSVDHLHLHCLELPFRSRIKALKHHRPP